MRRLEIELHETIVEKYDEVDFNAQRKLTHKDEHGNVIPKEEDPLDDLSFVRHFLCLTRLG
jgi:hypothetical protein